MAVDGEYRQNSLERESREQIPTFDSLYSTDPREEFVFSPLAACRSNQFSPGIEPLLSANNEFAR